MPSPSAATLLAGLCLVVAAPAAAQDVATVFLKEGGTIRGQVVDESDPSAIRVRSEKSGTTFMLKRAWVDSVVRPAAASAPAQVIPAPAPMKAAVPVPVAAPAQSAKPAEPKPVAAKAVEPTPVAVVAVPPARAAEPPVVVPEVQVDGLEPPANVPSKQVKAAKQPKDAAAPVRSPSKWYIGGGGSAYTGTAGSSTDMGYTGMIGYGTGIGNAVAVRLGGSGSYWRLGTGSGDFYDLAGNIDVVVGPRSPRFVAPYAVLGGMGGVRSVSPVQVGATGYTRDPLYGARLGGGVSAKRIFLEASYQHVWVNGVSSGYVPFVFGFRF